MGLKILLKKFKVRRLSLMANEQRWASKRSNVSHGFHIVEKDGESDCSVVLQREHLEGLEASLFSVYDKNLEYEISSYLQANIFGKKLSKNQIRRKTEDMMKKAYVSARAKIEKGCNLNKMVGCATVLLLDNHRFMAANFGGYKAVVCADGVASHLGQRSSKRKKGNWSISGLLNMACTFSNLYNEPHMSTELVITTRRLDSTTEFVIIGSDGVWEVMRSQEAVDLVNHIQDPQKAAECLAEEALMRMSKSTISCIVIRFH